MQHPERRQLWPEAILFDLDGTLIDSAPDIAAALNEVFARRGLPPFDLPAVKRMIGGGLPKLIERALAAHSISEPDPQPIVAEAAATYASHATELTALFDGVADALGDFQRAGIMMAVCTNKRQDLTDIILRDLGIAGYFGAVVGARDGLPLKPDPASLILALNALGVPAARAVMVGDFGADTGAAKAAGMPVILATFGYSTTPVADLAPDAIFGHFAELPAALRGMRLSR